jgi:hypothetical protein
MGSLPANELTEVTVKRLIVYARGKEEAPFVCEVKSRKNGGDFVRLETWLADFDCLFLKRNHATPLVVLPWRVWRSLLEQTNKR